MSSTVVCKESRRYYRGRSGRDWEAVVGLEIHAELNTKTKLFSAAPNRFGDEPNTNISVVDTAQPGALPVLNKEAVRKAVELGCALKGHIAKFSKFDRKSYFYPDSPRNFQITQFDEPIIIGGEVTAEVDEHEKTFQIHHVHLEDDAGMLKHFSTFAGVDFNRAGVPLVEIVSEPCIHTPEEAVAYAMAIRAILQYIDASNCNMEEGSLRFDANISVRPRGEQKLWTKVEIKNMNSFNFLGMAVEAEIHRQIAAYEERPEADPKTVIQQATFRWDPDEKKTVLMREKESADDYRYFPEPDLPPIVLTDAFIEKIRLRMPELPLQRKRRYVADLGLSEHSAWVITCDKQMADYFQEGLAVCSNARALCNWITIEFAGRLKESGKSLIEHGIPAREVATLVAHIDSGTITGKIAKKVAEELVKDPTRTVTEIVASNSDFQPLTDTREIEEAVDKVLAESPEIVAEIRGGQDRKFGFLVGQVMKLTRGKASPQIVNDLLKAKIGN